MNREHILSEIRRTAEANGGVPLGRVRFLAETGIREADWSGKYWVRWNDAVAEAGYTPNELQGAFSDDELLEKLAQFVRELGHFPVTNELKMKRKSDQGFPNHKVFDRFGRKGEKASRLFEYCVANEGYRDVAEACAPVAKSASAPTSESLPTDDPEFGYVYLMKSGKYYKIGRTNSVERRHRELGIQLPEKLRLLHSIKTDDPAGIEHYWHRRFKEKRLNGEWFELTAADVSAFRRRKFM